MDLQLNKHSDASYLPTYQDIFNARGDSYNEACRTFHGVRETERALLIDRLDVTPNQVCCDAPAGGGYLAEGLEKSHGSHRGIICLEPAEKFLQGIPPRFDRVLGSLTAMPLASAVLPACTISNTNERCFTKRFACWLPAEKWPWRMS